MPQRFTLVSDRYAHDQLAANGYTHDHASEQPMLFTMVIQITFPTHSVFLQLLEEPRLLVERRLHVG